MQAVIMAGGKGVRLKPLTDKIPKCMVKVKNKPLLENIFDVLLKAGVSEFVLVVGYLREVIEDYFGPDYMGAKISYVVQEEPKGTAHAVSLTETLIIGDFLVVNADVLTSSENISKLVKVSEFEDFDALLLAKKVSNPWRYGVLKVENEFVVDIVEKPNVGEEPGNLINAGIYRFPKRFFESVKETRLSVRKEFELVDSIRIFISKGGKVGYKVIEGTFCHITDFDDLVMANKISDDIFPK
ncbi:MAG: sugar phosphate nucleotidyltransferase [Candidatus Diapherotrites archaeon]